MPGRITPKQLITPNCPLGYDGSDYYMFGVDVNTDGRSCLRVAFPNDREMSWVNAYWTATVGNHSSTERWSYTVPSGKRSLLLAIFILVGVPSTGTNATAWVTLNTYRLAQVIMTGTSTLDRGYANIPYQFWLKPGDVLKGYSYNGGTTPIEFHVNAFIVEYRA